MNGRCAVSARSRSIDIDFVGREAECALIKSFIGAEETRILFYYEFECIRSFSDGHGRMGRLWQTLILSKWNGLFVLVPPESVIKDNIVRLYLVVRIMSRELLRESIVYELMVTISFGTYCFQSFLS